MTLKDLYDVNAEVNQMPWVSDLEVYGQIEKWERPILARGDDCDGSMVAKMRKLIERGWPIDKLRFALCWTETQEYHAVLLADFDGQTYVLDNRFPDPVKYQDAEWHGYKFDKIQIAGTTQWQNYA